MNFSEVIRKNRCVFGWKWFRHILFHGKVFTKFLFHRKLPVLWRTGCNRCEEEIRGKRIRKGKGFSKVSWQIVNFFFFYPFSIFISFSFIMMFARYGKIWSKLERCFTWIVLEITADSSSLRFFLHCAGLLRVASEKLNVFEL